LPERGLTLVLGGARSGKSRFAEGVVTATPPPWLYLATAQALDAEMAERIAAHSEGRGAGWETSEAPLDLVRALEQVPQGGAVLVDCLTLWLTNVLLAGRDVEAESDRLADTLARPAGLWVVVANEVGLGIVPENALARRFRDAAGRLNQRIAAVADRVVLTVAGLPLQVK
jgi:adenosylcobinamide kinase/adenosylcobinamide-phosphate guanylyltransferase